MVDTNKVLLPLDRNTTPIPGFEYTGTRARLLAGATTSNTTIPTDSADKWVVIRVSAPAYLNFGTSGVTASLASSSILWTGSELVFKVPSTATHFAGIRVGATDVEVELELLKDS